MNIRIGSFSKRHNSTLQPAANWGTLLQNVELKDDSSMEEPVFRLGYSTWNAAYNYIYVTDWNRYYFVTNVNITLGRVWEIECKLDLLGTYKADIQAVTAFVMYDEAANTEIVDNRIPTKTTAVYAENNVILNENASAAGSYLCCVTGETSTDIFRIPNVSWLTNVIADPNQGLRHYVNDVYADQVWSDWTEAIAEFLRTTGKNMIASGNNIFENIRSIIWVPWRIETTQNKMFNLGAWYSGASADVVTTIFQRTSAQITIPWQFSDWRRNEPYTYVYLYIPFVGVIHIPSSQIINQTVIDIEMAFNQMSGEIAFRIYAGNVQLGAYGANTAIQIPFGASQISPAQKLNSVVSAAAGIAGAVATGNIITAAAGAAAALAAVRPLGASVGGIGGGAGGALDLHLRCFTVSHDTVVQPGSIAQTMGTPAMLQQSMSSKSGFVQTQNASVQGSTMTDAARQEINRMLDSGIYIE